MPDIVALMKMRASVKLTPEERHRIADLIEAHEGNVEPLVYCLVAAEKRLAEAHERIRLLEAQIAKDHPIVDFTRRVMESYDSDAVADGLRHFLAECKKNGDTT